MFFTRFLKQIFFIEILISWRQLILHSYVLYINIRTYLHYPLSIILFITNIIVIQFFGSLVLFNVPYTHRAVLFSLTRLGGQGFDVEICGVIVGRAGVAESRKEGGSVSSWSVVSHVTIVQEHDAERLCVFKTKKGNCY